MDLKKIKRSVCNECNRRGQSGQPLKKCRECRKKFCIDHSWGGQYQPTRMTINEELAIICTNCKNKYGYI